jgi:hypothetical protein
MKFIKKLFDIGGDDNLLTWLCLKYLSILLKDGDDEGGGCGEDDDDCAK